ncbi:hypothetical protein J4731_13265 [Providencia rettgeri]|nr:hypothetical protein [Providencia rettgeri]
MLEINCSKLRDNIKVSRIKIQFNLNELNKLKIAQSSVFAVPTPNVPTLSQSHGVGLNTQATQTANSNIVKGVENT